MKKSLIAVYLVLLLFLAQSETLAGTIGDPGASLNKKAWALSQEFSGMTREIRDRDGIRYDTESYRLFLKGSYGIKDWLEGFGRLGGVMAKIEGTPFNSNLGIAGGAGLKATFLDPPAHPLCYSLGAQFLYWEAGDRGAQAKWFEYDIWAGLTHRGWNNLVPYGGIVYSRVDGKMKDFPSNPALDEFKSPTAVGIFFGLNWKIKEKLHLGIDARLFGENSGTFSLNYLF